MDEKDCIAYLKENAVWDRVLSEFRNKYRSYGSFAGTIVLDGLREDEISELEGFFAKNYHGRKAVRITAEQFSQALAQSRFAGVDPERLLELYFGWPLRSKSEEQRIWQSQREEILHRLQMKYQGTQAQHLLTDVAELAKLKKIKSHKEWEQQLTLSAEIINHLPYRRNKLVYLAVFATQITGDPHAFDYNRDRGQLLCQLVTLELQKHHVEVDASDIFPALQRQQSFLKVGILLNDVSNYALLYGVTAFKQNGMIHEGTRGFFEEGDMMQIPLSVLNGWKRIECVEHRIYIVENPSVYAELCAANPNASYMCMNGQPHLAGLMVLELLAASDTEVYYAGDLDPEGILIAQKLAQFYKGTFHYWHMTAEEYEKSLSNEIYLPENRIKSLDNITDVRLQPVVELIRQKQLVGYQERIFDGKI